MLSSGVFFLFTNIARKTDVFLREPYSATAVDKAILAVQIPLFYLEKLVVPLRLSADYGVEQFGRTMTDPRVILALLLLVGLTGAAWLIRNKAGLAAFSIAWFLITLIPVLHLFPTIPIIADRYAYLPSFGFCLLLALTARRLQGSSLLFVAVPPVILLGVFSWQQNLVWKNEKTLWENTLIVSPRSTTALAELGRIFFSEEKNIPKAMEMYRRASEVDPADPSFDIFQGHLFMMKKDFTAAVTAFSRAVEKDRGNIEAAVNLGRAYQSAGNIELAREQYRQAVELPELDPRTNMRSRAADYLKRLGP
jgi:tetratricopeptide (TPR) repeat protein